MRNGLVVLLLLLLCPWIGWAELSYDVGSDGNVTRVRPTRSTDGRDVEAVKELAKQFPMSSYTGGTKEDMGGGDKNGHPEPNWPPKEVEDEVQALPTQAELDELKVKMQEYKNTKDPNLFEKVNSEVWKMCRRLAPTDTTGLTVADWEKRVGVFVNLEALVKTTPNMGASRKVMWDKLPEWSSKSKGHAEFFATLQWVVKNKVAFKMEKDIPRRCVYAYMEASNKFPDVASRKLFCSQLSKGGIKDESIIEFSKEIE